MFSTDRPEQPADGDVAERGCVALVAVAQQAQWSPRRARPTLPDPTFVAHLIAAAEQVPQPRGLQHAASADALSAYRSYRAPRHVGTGAWTRQTI